MDGMTAMDTSEQGRITVEGRRLGPEGQEGRRLFREQMHRLRELVLDAGLRDAA